MTRRTEPVLVCICVIVIFAIGLAVRLFRLGDESLYLDEAASWRFAKLPLRVLWTEAVDDHPPLYYSLLHLWMNFGDSPSSLRLISAIGGALAAPLAFLLGRQIGGMAVGLLSALFVALSTLQLEYSQDARSYALLSAAALACGVGFLGFFDRVPKNRRELALWAAFYGGSMVVCLYLHHIAALLFGICLSLGCFEASRRRVTGLTLGWLTINALVVIAWAWWLRFIYWLLAYGVAGLSWLSPPTLATATETLRAIYGEPYVNSGQPFVDAGCVLMGLVGLYAIRSRRIELLFMTAVTIGIPAAEIVVSLLKQPVFTVQTVEWVSPYFLVLIAAALTRLPWRSAVLAAIVLLAIRAIGLKNYFEVQKHEDWRAVATALDRHLCRGDLVLFGPFYLVEPIRYYLRDRLKDANQLGLQYDSGTILDPRLWPLATGTVSAEGTTIAAAPRVWVVSRQPGGIGPFDTELQPFLSSHAMVERVQAKSLLLRLYVDHTNSATCG